MMKSSKQESTTFFYAEFDESSSKIQFDGEESAHLFVLRVSEGTEIIVTNGLGLIAKAQVSRADKRKSSAELLPGSMQKCPAPQSRLAIGFLKGRDLEEVVDLCSQLDLLSIDILHTDYSQSSRKENHHALLRRMEQRSLTGLKQARKAWLTQIRGPFELGDYLGQNEALHLLLDFDGIWPPAPMEAGERILYCGPEGGFSPAEIQLLKSTPQNQSLYLGNTRLRARTAPLYALGMLQALELKK